MEEIKMNRLLGTKWFTFYTKVRPCFACLAIFSVIADFIQYTNIYLNNWWMLLSFAISIAGVILCILVAIKSRGDYLGFVRFVKGVLLFETLEMTYQFGINLYIKSAFNIGVTFITSLFILLFYYSLWYRLNVKYFEKRILTYSDSCYDIESETNKARFCIRCGNQLMPEDNFCYRCDSIVTSPISSIYNHTDEDKIYKQESPKRKFNRDKIVLFIILGIALVLTIIGIIYLIISPNSSYINTYNDDTSSFSYDEDYNYSDDEYDDITDELLPYQTLMNTCLRDGCYNYVSSAVDYCYLHKCTQNGCNNQRDGTSTYCLEHKCSTSYCMNAPTNDSLYCIEHKCAKSGCSSAKQLFNPYCLEHGCADITCDNIADGGGQYCKAHTCLENSCNSSKKSGSDYCYSHACFFAYCNNRKIGESSYCSEHKCAKSDCELFKEEGSDYCSFDECFDEYCHKAQSGSSLYCSEHKCSKSGCNLPKSSSSKYCFLHS